MLVIDRDRELAELVAYGLRRAGIDFLAVHDAGLHWILRYRGRAWNNVEPEVQRDWTQRYLANPLGPSERVRARLLGEYDRR